MEIEFLYFEGCLGHVKARPLLEGVLAEERIADPIRFIKIEGQDDAARHRFLGSPTIRIDGRDVEEQPDADYSLRCRVYWIDGRPQDYPDKETIRAAIRAAGGGGNVG